MARRKKKKTKSYAEKVLAGTHSTRPQFAKDVDAYNVKARARKAKALSELRTITKADKYDFGQLTRAADKASGSKDTLSHTEPPDWEDIVSRVRDIPPGVDKNSALSEYDANEPRRTWKGRKLKKKSASLNPMIRRIR